MQTKDKAIKDYVRLLNLTKTGYQKFFHQNRELRQKINLLKKEKSNLDSEKEKNNKSTSKVLIDLEKDLSNFQLSSQTKDKAIKEYVIFLNLAKTEYQNIFNENRNTSKKFF